MIRSFCRVLGCVWLFYSSVFLMNIACSKRHVQQNKTNMDRMIGSGITRALNHDTDRLAVTKLE